jgi:hypothetical protein
MTTGRATARDPSPAGPSTSTPAPHAQGIERTFRCEVGKAAPDGTRRNPGRADDGRDTAVAGQAGFCGSQKVALPLVQMR